MKKTYKRALGFMSLVIVVATTAFAATLPGPEASATTVAVTDTIKVHVAGTSPNIDIVGYDGGDEVLVPQHSFSVEYENVRYATITLKYTDADGNTAEYLIDTLDPDYEPGSKSYNINVEALGYGYGEYLITARGQGEYDLFDIDYIHFTYLPVYPEIEEDSDENGFWIGLNYLTNNEGAGVNAEDVAKIVINVYDENGNLVNGLSPVNILPPMTKIFLAFGEYGLESGYYTIVINAYDKDGLEIYKAYEAVVYYEARRSIAVPDTGSFFSKLNISETDYLLTGLLIFGLIGISGFVLIVRKDKKGSRRRR